MAFKWNDIINGVRTSALFFFFKKGMATTKRESVRVQALGVLIAGCMEEGYMVDRVCSSIFTGPPNTGRDGLETSAKRFFIFMLNVKDDGGKDDRDDHNHEK